MSKVIASTIDRFPFAVCTEDGEVGLKLRTFATDGESRSGISEASFKPDDARDIAAALTKAANELNPKPKQNRKKKKKGPRTETT